MIKTVIKTKLFKMFYEFCDSVRAGIFKLNKSWSITCVLIWIVGVQSNLLNIVIFGHKNMQNPTNSILWWLAISDLLELYAIALYGWCCEWCTYIDLFFPGLFVTPYYVSVLFLSSIYLIHVFHTITLGLNVILAFWRYLVIAHPLQRKFRCDNRSVRKTVLLLYVLSFVTGLTVLYALKIHRK